MTGFRISDKVSSPGTTNVKTYGAVGDGVTDDTAAIVAAIAAVTSNGVLLFPEGTYLTSAAVAIAAPMRIEGYRATIKASGAMAAVMVLTSDSINVKGLTLNGNFLANYGLKLSTAAYCSFSDCTFTNALFDGVFRVGADASDLSVFTDCDFATNGQIFYSDPNFLIASPFDTRGFSAAQLVEDVGAVITFTNGNAVVSFSGMQLITNYHLRMGDGLLVYDGVLTKLYSIKTVDSETQLTLSSVMGNFTSPEFAILRGDGFREEDSSTLDGAATLEDCFLNRNAGSGVRTTRPYGAKIIRATVTNQGAYAVSVGHLLSGIPPIGVKIADLNASNNSGDTEILALAANALLVEGVVSTKGAVTVINSALVQGSVTGDSQAAAGSSFVSLGDTGSVIANQVTGHLTGNVTGNVSGSAGTFTGSLAGDVTGTQASTAVAYVGTSSAANVHAAELLANAATNANTASTIVKRDASGNFTAGIITAGLTGNVTGNASGTAGTFTGSLTGDVTSTGMSTVVAFVGTSSAANVHAAELLANAATNLNTVSTIVKRDASGNFTAGVITASLTGNVTGNASGTSATFTGSLTGDVTSTGMSTAVAFVGTSSAANVHAAELLANAATNANTASTIVKRDASGNFTAGTITANLTGNASGTAATFTGSLTGDVTSTGMSTAVAFVGTSSAANVHAAELLANAATNSNTASTIVKRDASGNFAAGVITADIDKAAGSLNLGASASIINIGGAGATVNMLGTLTYVQTTNSQVSDSLLTLNKGGAAASGGGSGLEIEENTSIVGYGKISGDRNSWTFKAPATAGIATITAGAGGITLDQSSHNPVTIGTANGLSLSTQALSLQLASASQAGALSAADWSTFSAGGAGITALTSDVTATGPGSAVATVAFVGTSSAANVHAAELLANAATNANTASTIVKRDASGNFTAGIITMTEMVFASRRVLVAAAAPVAGTWAVGDIVYNSTPVAGGSIGWVCTTAGTPGTWKQFGLISL